MKILQRRKKKESEKYLKYFLISKCRKKSNKIELKEEFMVIRKEEQPPEVFCKKGVIRHFAKLTGKHLSQSLLFNNVAGLAKFFRTLLQITSGQLFPKFEKNAG